MSLDYATTSYPKNMSYHMERIVNYSKMPVKIECDRLGNVNHSETIRFKLPTNTLVDLDSLIWNFDFTTIKAAAADNNTCRYFPRNSASIIDALYVYVNGTLLDATTYYNHLYNLISDHTCGKDFYESGLRDIENADPSFRLKYDNSNGTMAPFVSSQATHTADDTDVNRRMSVRNWLGFLGTASTRVIDTSLLGDVVIEIRLAEPTITFKSGTANDNPASYTINGSKTNMQITRITFGDSVYYDLLRNIVMNSGLAIGYKTYNSHRGNTFTKTAGTFTHQFMVNANHLTKLISTTLPSTYQTEGKLLNKDQAKSWESQKDTTANLEQMFNQSAYFQKDATGLGSINYEVNGVSMYPANQDVHDIINQNQVALNLNGDIQAGCHPGMNGWGTFLKYYFMHVLSFEHIQNTSEFVLEGLDGKASAISCKWSLNFDAPGIVGALIPLVYSERQQVLQINAGQQISII